jgi:trans-aconitate 2-methyltransferase
VANPSNSREWDASAYHRISQPQLSWGKKVLARLPLRGDECLLDAGCGTGRLTEELLTLLPHGRVVALDLSQKMLTTAKDYLKTNFGDRLQFVAADLLDLPFDRAFDGIFSTAAFHWVPDHNRLFSNLFRVLRPGGWLRAQCGGGPNLARLRERVRVLARTPKFAPFLEEFRDPWTFNDAETAAAILRQVGFVEVNTSIEPAFTVLSNEREYVEFVSSVILHRHLERVPEPGLRSQFVEQLAKQTADDDPPFSLDYWRLNLNATAP